MGVELIDINKQIGLKLTLFAIGTLLLLSQYKDYNFGKLNLLLARHFTHPNIKPFNERCGNNNNTAPGRAQSVHRLRAHDVGVVAAIGDSISTGNGIYAQDMEEVWIEHRDMSWSVGGNRSIDKLVTLPNLLRMFRQNVAGYATSENANFNMAVPGQRASDLLNYQVYPLIEKIKANASLYANEWKIVTLQIGTGDLCRFCESQWETELSTATNLVNSIKQVLDTFASNLPRTFVNLVGPFYIVSRANESGLDDCYQRRAMLCSCQHNPRYSQLFNEYHDGLERLAMSAEYTERENFTVVFQPFAKEIGKRNLKSANKSELVSYDCLHLSFKGNNEAAKLLWNNMLEPVGHKAATQAEFKPELICPSSSTSTLFFRTKKNSK